MTRVLKPRERFDRRISSNTVSVDDFPYGFVLIPRVASTSIRKALLDFVVKEPDNIYRNEYIVTASDTKPLILICRNPLMRLLSVYKHLFLGYGLSPSMLTLGYSSTMSFGKFVERIKIVGPDADVHTAQQVSFIRKPSRIEFVGNFETIDESWTQIRKMTGIGPLPHLVASVKQLVSYSAETLDTVRNIYADDFRHFGYD